MNGYDFTERTRLVLARAREETVRLEYGHVLPEHIALALLAEDQGAARVVLANLGAEPGVLRQDIEARIAVRPRHDESSRPDLPYSEDAKRVLELAMAEARDLGDSHVGTEHLLLGIVREAKNGAAAALAAHDLTVERIRSELPRVRTMASAREPVPAFPARSMFDLVFKVSSGASKQAQAAQLVSWIALVVALVALGIVLIHR